MAYIDLEEDYEFHCLDGYRIDENSGAEVPVGLCSRMCPYEEMEKRERTARLHKFEMLPHTNPPEVDPDRCIKMATRSSAGSETVRSMELRPWSVLRRTLHYLLLDICLRENEDWMFVCDFVYDRLKAIRSDTVIQRIEGRRYVEILEGSVRFCIYSMYRLTCTLKDFSDKIDSDRKVVHMEGRVDGLDSRDLSTISEMKMTMKCLRDCLITLLYQYQENVPDSPNRPLFEAINIIVNLPFLHLSNRCCTQFQSDKKLRNKYPMFKIVFRMYLQHLVGNHLTALQHLPQLIDYPLLLMAYAPAIAQVQLDLVTMLRAACQQRAKSNCFNIKDLIDFICPQFLETNEEERLFFTRLIAVQNEIYDYKSDSIVFKPKVATSDEKSNSGDNSLNETRIFALMMVFGKDWQMYRDSIEMIGLKNILDPSQPKDQPDFGTRSPRVHLEG